jgi:hypothetical protein
VELREHMLAGRLTSEEFEDRLGAVYEARTQADLDAVRADLPMSPAAIDHALVARRARLRRRLAQEGGGAVGLWVMCIAIWAASGAQASFWPIWVIIATAIPLVRNGWRLLGPAPDPDAVEAHLNAKRRHQLERERRRARRGELPK